MKKFSHKLVEIDNYITIKKACQYALDNSRMIGIFGYEGAGKTIALKKFYQDNRQVQYIRVTKSMSTSDFYKKLLGFQYEPSKGYRSLYRIMERLTSISYNSDENKLLIIDEAGKFTYSDLEYLHEFRDRTENSLGIIFAGQDYFHEQLLFGVKHKVKGLPEFYRRLNFKIWLERPKRTEIKAICKQYGIEDTNLLKDRFFKHENFSDLTNDIERYLVFEKLADK